MFIDSHLHLNLKRLGLRDLISYMDRERIDLCWLLTWDELSPMTTDYVPLAVEDVFEAYSRYPSRIVPMYAPDPRRPDAVERFKAWHEKGICGCGELKSALWWDSEELAPLLSFLDRLELPLVFHMERGGPRYRPTTGSALELDFARFMNSPRVGALGKRAVERVAEAIGPLRRKKEKMRYFFSGYLMNFQALERRLKEYPGIKFIGHGPSFWEGISTDMGHLLSNYGNMYADISAHSGYAALTRNKGFARRFLSEYSHKVLYGTDNFSLGLKPYLDSLGLSKGCYRRIYGENAYDIISAGHKRQPPAWKA